MSLAANGRRAEASREVVAGPFFELGRQMNSVLLEWNKHNGDLAAQARESDN